MSKIKPFFKYIVFAGVMLIPLIYSFFYLKAYWDPYGNMNKLPVALVNEDKGEKGQALADNLKERNILEINQVDSEKAKKGLEDKTYYATITLPEDFTANLESASEKDKVKAEIKYSPNQKSNYLASQMINAVMRVVEKSVRSEVSEAVVSTLSDKLNEVPEKLGQITDGATQLQSGANQLSNGLDTLNTKYITFDNGLGTVYAGSAKLSNGLIALNSGLNTLYAGADRLNSGVAQINTALENLDTSKFDVLITGVNQLDDGANTLSTNLNTYVSGVEQLAGGISQLGARLSARVAELDNTIAGLQDQLSQLPQESPLVEVLQNLLTQAQTARSVLGQLYENSDLHALFVGANALIDTSIYGVTPGQALTGGATQLKDGTNQLKNGVTELKTLAASLDTLKDSLKTVEDGTESLLDGIAKLQSGSASALSGSDQLTSGLGELKSGSTSVKDGINALDSGTYTLANGVTTLKNSVEQGTADTKESLKTLEGLDDFTANPVEVVEEDVGKIEQYGVSFTPLFLAIGLWVGALMCYVVLYYDQEHRFKFLDKENRSLKQSAAYLGIAVGFGLLTAFLLKTFIGFPVNDIATYYLGSALSAVTFMALIQCLITVFGDIGKFFALIILVLQLAASGGTFPIETVNSAFHWLNPLLPMTHSINLFKEATISTTPGVAWSNSLALIVVLAISFSVTVIYYHAQKAKK